MQVGPPGLCSAYMARGICSSFFLFISISFCGEGRGQYLYYLKYLTISRKQGFWLFLEKNDNKRKKEEELKKLSKVEQC